ncbi:MAG: acyltransferase family protein [Pseudomonadota bacterium]
MPILYPVHVLRAIAALIVVLSHYRLFYGQTTGWTETFSLLKFGDAGVDLFFVISGFIMVYAAERLYGTAGASFTFFVHRLIRIVPLYWLVTTLYVFVAWIVPSFGKSYAIEFVIASYFFLPWPQLDGVMQPVVGQGWTLNYEMPFYLVFSLALFAPRRAAVLGACLVLTTVVVAGLVFQPGQPILKFLTYPIIIEFVFGMLIGLAYREGVRLPSWAGWTLIIAGLGLIFSSEQMHAWASGRVILWGVPAALVVAGATLGQVQMSGRGWRGLVLIGEASYALYLTHSIPLRGTLALMRIGGLDMAVFAWPGLVFGTFASVVLAVAVYYIFELPSRNALRRMYDGRQQLKKPEAALAQRGVP